MLIGPVGPQICKKTVTSLLAAFPKDNMDRPKGCLGKKRKKRQLMSKFKLSF